jgi:hypothetical protein
VVRCFPFCKLLNCFLSCCSCNIWDLYNIDDDAWIVIRMLQTEATTIVKWKGKFSTGFLTQQGIRQGAKLSPTLYKGYNNQLLDILRDNNIGAKIGITFIGCPTVADDIALIAYHPEDLQHALHIVHNETRRDCLVDCTSSISCLPSVHVCVCLFLPPLTMTTSLFVELMVTLSLLVSLCTICNACCRSSGRYMDTR